MAEFNDLIEAHLHETVQKPRIDHIEKERQAKKDKDELAETARSLAKRMREQHDDERSLSSFMGDSPSGSPQDSRAHSPVAVLSRGGADQDDEDDEDIITTAVSTSSCKHSVAAEKMLEKMVEAEKEIDNESENAWKVGVLSHHGQRGECKWSAVALCAHAHRCTTPGRCRMY